jgi:hypothetical protein
MYSDISAPESDEDDELRRLWQATPASEAPSSAAAMREQLAGRRRRILLQKASTLAVLLLAPVLMVWVFISTQAGALGLAGLLLSGIALLASIWRKYHSLQLYYTYPAVEAPATYVARLRRYYRWQQRYGLPFYQGYIILLNTGLALYFADAYRGHTEWQAGLLLGLAGFTLLVLRQYSRRYALQEQQETEQLLQALQRFE